MTKKLRMAAVGFAHMHLETLVKDFSSLPDGVEWLGCADVPPYPKDPQSGRSRRIQDAAAWLDNMPVFDNYLDLLSAKPDLAIVCSDNRAHPDVVEALLKRNIHAVVEKPMAASLEDGLRMARAASQSTASLIINWPVTWMPVMHLAQKLTTQGAVGKPLRFHYRNADSLGPFSHGGPAMTEEELKKRWWYQHDRGGGALLDYCGYGCMLAQYFLQTPPVSAFCSQANLLNTFAEIEDYATMTIHYDQAFAILEGSWVNIGTEPFASGPIVYGSEGTLFADRASNQVKVCKDFHGSQVKTYDVEPVDPRRASLARELYHHITTGEPVHPTLGVNLNLQALAALDAGVRSAGSHQLETTGNI